MAKKIPVSQSSQPLAANPFAALELTGLPAGPVELEGSRGADYPGPDRAAAGEIPSGRQDGVVAADFGAQWSVPAIEELATRARRACGCGGTVAGREIELQGDDAARVRRFFEVEGFRVAGI